MFTELRKQYPDFEYRYSSLRDGIRRVTIYDCRHFRTAAYSWRGYLSERRIQASLRKLSERMCVPSCYQPISRGGVMP